MCGICGYLADEQARPSVESIVERFLSIESRGSDASGFSASVDGRLWRLRAPVPAHVLAQYKKSRTLLVDQASAWIGHTRLATRGLASNNENNHPFMGSGLSLVHNGIICDYAKQAEHLKPDLQGECDSELILRLIQRGLDRGGSVTSSIQMMARKLDGDMACALISRDGQLWVWRRESSGFSTPLWLALQAGVQAVHFASTGHCLEGSLPNSKAWDLVSLPNLSGARFWLKDSQLMSKKFTLAASQQSVWGPWNDEWEEALSQYVYSAPGAYKKKVYKEREAKRGWAGNVLPLGVRADALYVCEVCDEWFMPEEVFDHKVDYKHYTFREEL